MKLLRYAAMAALLCGLSVAAAADPAGPVKKETPKAAIKFPDLPTPPAPVPVPAPPVEPAAYKLGPGQFYVIASANPLLILDDGDGKVDSTIRKPPFMLPAATAVGWTPAKDDPEFVYWGNEYPYLYVLKAAKTGTVKLTVIPAVTTTDGEGKQVPLTKADVQYRTLSVVDGKPTPPEPKPPEPKPPEPGFGTNPFGGQPGLRVMIVFESSTAKDLPVGKYVTIHGAKFRKFLDDNCVKDGYRMFDPNMQVADDAAIWRDALKLSDRKTLPWLYVGKEGSGYSGPLAADPEANMAIINKVSGK